MELLDIYDLSGNRTGRTVERDQLFGHVSEDSDRLLLVHVCVFNSLGEMLIQRRQLTKDRYPGCWDVSAGGFALSGESSEDAIRRELFEELGIAADEVDIQLALREPFHLVFDDFYLCRAELDLSALHLQEQEVMAARWAGRDEVLTMLSTGEFVDYEPRLIRDMFDAADRAAESAGICDRA